MAAWERHRRELQTWIARRLGEAQDAEDPMQDTVVKALSMSRQFCEIAGGRASLFAVVRNAIAYRLVLRAIPPSDGWSDDHGKEL
jgi:DNA-directed RNA polymerase specialized sigma24 family protein